MGSLGFSKKQVGYWGIFILFSILFIFSLIQNWNYYWSTGFILIITVHLIIFNLRNKKESNWPLVLIFTGYTFLMIGLLINNLTSNLEFLVWIFLLVILGFIFLALVITSYNFIKSKKLISILLNYLLMAFLLIGLFAGIYLYSGDIYYKENPLSEQGATLFDYFYFSGLTFYLTGDSNFSPMKISRILVLIQIFTSFALHGVILQEVISKRRE